MLHVRRFRNNSVCKYWRKRCIDMSTTKRGRKSKMLRDNFILTDGHEINDHIPRHTMITIDVKKDASQYNLMIDNVTADDFGVYLCEMQLSKQVSQHQVTLADKGKTMNSGVWIYR